MFITYKGFVCEVVNDLNTTILKGGTFINGELITFTSRSYQGLVVSLHEAVDSYLKGGDLPSEAVLESKKHTLTRKKLELSRSAQYIMRQRIKMSKHFAEATSAESIVPYKELLINLQVVVLLLEGSRHQKYPDEPDILALGTDDWGVPWSVAGTSTEDVVQLVLHEMGVSEWKDISIYKNEAL